MKRQKRINKMLKRISCGFTPYVTYGRVFKLSAYHIIIIICMVTPCTNWLIPFFIFLSAYELARFTIHNKINGVCSNGI